MSDYQNQCKKCKPGSFAHIIKKGDTLYSISVKHSTTVERLLEINPEVDIYNLQIGSIICVPLPAQYYPFCRTTNYYVVQENDTLFSISQYFGVSIKQILYHNIGIYPENVYRGMVLCIPIAPSPVEVKISGGKLCLKYETGNEECFSCIAPNEQISSVVVTKQLENPNGGPKKLNLLTSGISICSESAECSKRSVIVSDSDMDTIFNRVPICTEVEIL